MKHLSQFGSTCCRVLRRMWITQLPTCLLIIGGGCTSADQFLDNDFPDSGKPIVFQNSTAYSRATVTESVRKIGVFGYSHSGSFPDALSTRFPDYFLNQSVIDLSGSGNWHYDGITRYWPQNGNSVSFFAYAPYMDLGNLFSLYPTASTDAGSPKITYTVPSNMDEQIDLLWSNALNQSETSNGGIVDFEMNHALTRVDFAIKLDDGEKERPYIITINSLTVQNIVGSGVLDLSKSPGDASLWSISRPATDSGWAGYSLTPASGGGLQELVFDARTTVTQKYDPYAYTSLFAADRYLMLIPQRLDNLVDALTPAQITLSYTFTNVYSGEINEREKVIPLSQSTLTEWKQGQGVTYKINLSLVEGTTIELDIEGFITGTLWDDVNSSNPITGTVN